MEFGSVRTDLPLDTEGSLISLTEFTHKGAISKRFKHFRVRVKVSTPEEEMQEFLNFTENLRDRKNDGTLIRDREDKSTCPAFIVEYPYKDDGSGSYFIIKSWTELV